MTTNQDKELHTTGSGASAEDPIIAMSIDPIVIARDVRASLAFYGRTDDDYWIGKAQMPEEFSNRLWHQGWNAYWEARLEPGNEASADPSLGSLPAIHWAEPVEPPVVPPSTDETVLTAIAALSTKVDANTKRIQQQIDQVVKNAEHSAGPAILKILNSDKI